MQKKSQRPLKRRYGRIFGPARLVAHYGKVLGVHRESLFIYFFGSKKVTRADLVTAHLLHKRIH